MSVSAYFHAFADSLRMRSTHPRRRNSIYETNKDRTVDLRLRVSLRSGEVASENKNTTDVTIGITSGRRRIFQKSSSSDTVNFLRPRALRAAKTRRPLAVAILSRNPCLFFLFLLEG
jgi:hypothetical protein